VLFLDESYTIPVARKKLKLVKRRKPKVKSETYCFMDMIRHIQERAAEHDPWIRILRGLVLFSTESGDAWVLDTDDQTANRIAVDGVPRTVYIYETDKDFAINWQGHYRIDDEVFVYADHTTGRVVSILGYPDDFLQEILKQQRSSRPAP
jgi:hypothetical protein